MTIDPLADHYGDAGGVRSQLLFRDMNDQIRALAVEFGADSDCDLVCECADGACFERVTVPLDDYTAIRRSSSHFIVRHGHVAEHERIVGQGDRYDIVERIA